MNIPVTNCWRCNNELTYREIKAQTVYCTPCAKVRAEEKYRKELGERLQKANKKAGMS